MFHKQNYVSHVFPQTKLLYILSPCKHTKNLIQYCYHIVVFDYKNIVIIASVQPSDLLMLIFLFVFSRRCCLTSII